MRWAAVECLVQVEHRALRRGASALSAEGCLHRGIITRVTRVEESIHDFAVVMVFNDEKEWCSALSWDDCVGGVSLLCSSCATTVWGLPWGRSCGAGHKT